MMPTNPIGPRRHRGAVRGRAEPPDSRARDVTPREPAARAYAEQFRARSQANPAKATRPAGSAATTARSCDVEVAMSH